MKPPRLYWCTCGFPSHEPRACILCGGEAIEAYGVSGDASLVTDGVWRWLRKALVDSLGVSERTAERLAPGGPAARVKLDHVEVSYAVVYGGGVAGILSFEWDTYRWELSPRDWLASLVYRERLGYTGRLEVRAARGDVLPWSVYHGEKSEELGARLVARDVAGRIVVLRVEKAGLRVEHVEAYREDADYPRLASIDEFVRYNWEARVERMYREAVDWLSRVMEAHGPAVIRVSGGKDSSVAAAVYTEAGGERGVFTDTGWEHGSTVETVERLARSLSLAVDTVEPPRDCWRLLEAYGPPGRDYRWCTQLCKLAPTGGYIREAGARLVVTGNRALESPSRAREKRLSKSRGAGGGELVASPLHEWTALDVFTAVYAKRLPLNPVYEAGIERVGCFNCPSQSIPELEASARLEPGKWERWSRFLSRYARERDLPEHWLRYHLWRWRFNPPPRVRRAARSLLGFRWEKVTPRTAVTRVLRVGQELPSVRLNNAAGRLASMTDIVAVAPAVGALWEKSESHVAVRPSRHSLAVLYEGGDAYVESPSWDEMLELAEDAARALAMAGACTGCMLCVEACPSNAITVVERRRPVVDQRRCTACRKCLRVCPAASYSLLSQLVGLQKTIEAIASGEKLP